MTAMAITELRLRFGRHNKHFAFDERGNFKDSAPWFTRTAAQQGRPHHAEESRPIPPDEWTRVTLEIREHEQRLLVNDDLRHTWNEDVSGLRSRIGIGVIRSSLTVRALKVEPLL
jgi:hypothetical protein